MDVRKKYTIVQNSYKPQLSAFFLVVNFQIEKGVSWNLDIHVICVNEIAQSSHIASPSGPLSIGEWRWG
jgi:hypothetical protein